MKSHRHVSLLLILHLLCVLCYHGTIDDSVYVNWIHPDGTVKKTPAKIGQSLLEVAHKNGIELEGACEGSLGAYLLSGRIHYI